MNADAEDKENSESDNGAGRKPASDNGAGEGIAPSGFSVPAVLSVLSAPFMLRLSKGARELGKMISRGAKTSSCS